MFLTLAAFTLENPADPVVREPMLLHPCPGCVCYIADLRGKKQVTGRDVGCFGNLRAEEGNE